MELNLMLVGQFQLRGRLAEVEMDFEFGGVVIVAEFDFVVGVFARKYDFMRIESEILIVQNA
jgi:hypothetical protein